MTEGAAERVVRRAEHLLPEERAAGSEGPQAQAAAILADSDARERYEETAPGRRIEHHARDARGRAR